MGYILLASRMSEIVPGATAYQLMSKCEFIYFNKSLQPVNTLALACSGIDLIRLWPLPVLQPWFEDGLVMPGLLGNIDIHYMLMEHFAAMGVENGEQME